MEKLRSARFYIPLLPPQLIKMVVLNIVGDVMTSECIRDASFWQTRDVGADSEANRRTKEAAGFFQLSWLWRQL